MADFVKIQRAFFSTSDKEGILGFAKFLAGQGVEIIATGGTAKTLSDSGLKVTPIESITGNPEAFGGRMKSISFPFASALLYRRENTEDSKTAANLGIRPIDLVVCNLYPFAEAVKKGAAEPDLIEEIDVGGPTMLRAAAKNYAHVAIASHPKQYAALMEELSANQNALSLTTRKRLAAEAFQLSAQYEGMIAEELSRRFLGEETLFFRLQKGKKLRYGENPHQGALFFRDPSYHGPSIASAEVLQGKALSYNNILDADAAHRSASDAHRAVASHPKLCAVSIVKHLNPCGLAVAKTPIEALELAWEGDPISAFGGILCFTQEFDADCARWLGDKFIELLLAPSFSEEAIQILAQKKNLRLLLVKPDKGPEKSLRSVSGGMLVQEEDTLLETEFRSVTQSLFPKEKETLARFGVAAAKHLRSNAIALVREHKNSALQLVGAGMGQPNRIDSLKVLAAPRAKEKGNLGDLLLVSDAFFPFPDIIEEAKNLGIKTIIQPGGSIKDDAVISAADAAQISMAFTGIRHFRH